MKKPTPSYHRHRFRVWSNNSSSLTVSEIFKVFHWGDGALVCLGPLVAMDEEGKKVVDMSPLHGSHVKANTWRGGGGISWGILVNGAGDRVKPAVFVNYATMPKGSLKMIKRL